MCDGGARVGPTGEEYAVDTCAEFAGGPLGGLVAKVVRGIYPSATVDNSPREERFGAEPNADDGIAGVSCEVVHTDKASSAAAAVGARDRVAGQTGIDLCKYRLVAIRAKWGDDLVTACADVVDACDVVVARCKGACTCCGARACANSSGTCGFEGDHDIEAPIDKRS